MPNEPLAMFCDQCEQTYHGTGCVDRGVCGKSPDVESVQKLLLYGLKGMAAYKSHARRLGKTDPELDAFIEKALYATMTNVNFDLEALLEMTLECGAMNLRAMQLLNDGHVETLGKPEPNEVLEGIQEGPGILVTGHDLLDMKNLLEQTAGRGVNVYTHGEMLPAHMYTGLKQYRHLVGHYGGAWQKQRGEFETFRGPILATTNCVLIPSDSNTYLDRLFTVGATAVPGARRIMEGDFSPLIQRALEIGSLTPTAIKKSTTGFHYTAILAAAEQIVSAVKAGQINQFFLVGGCDGGEPGRNYFTEFAQSAPKDSIILTLGCGKYRIRDHEYGTVAGLPRFLDMGQCNDAFGAIQVAVALAEAFGGVKGIRLGPNMPAFITPGVFAILKEKFDIRPAAGNGRADVEAVMAAAACA
jgi:hydroxylamine reductase